MGDMATNSSHQTVLNNSILKSSTDSCNSEDMMIHHDDEIDNQKLRYPHSIVWTPIPCLTWLFPFIGHMGICTSNGVIRDFAGPYYVSEDCMAFGNPVKYWQLSLDKIPANNKRELWDRGVHDASEEYKGRMHNLFCDNCHSHVAYALNVMKYDNKNSWNMVNVWFYSQLHSNYTSFSGFFKTWFPAFIVICVIIAVVVSLHI